MIDPCRTFFDANIMPGRMAAVGCRTVATRIPQMIAITGAPITGANPPATVAAAAIATAGRSPGATFAAQLKAVLHHRGDPTSARLG